MLEQDEKDLVAEVKKLEEGLQSINQDALSLESTKDEIRFTERNAELIGQEVANLEIELDAPSRVKLYEHAEVPTAAEREEAARGHRLRRPSPSSPWSS